MRPSPSILLAVALGLAASATAQDWRGRARVDGRVTSEGDIPVVGATVTIDRLSGGRGPRLRSTADGSWAVDGIASGSWMIVIAAPGYRAARVGIHLPGDSSWLAPVEVRLEKAGAPPPHREAKTVTPAGPSGAAAPEAKEKRRPVPDALDDIRAALDAGRVERARALASSVSWEGAGEADTLFRIGAAFLAAGATTEAAAFLDVAVAADPAHVEAHYRRGLALLALGRHDEACDDFEAIVALRPDGAYAAKARQALETLAPGPAGE